jgi:hypothetical protein
MANFGALGTLRNAYRTLIKPSTSALLAFSEDDKSLLGPTTIRIFGLFIPAESDLIS